MLGVWYVACALLVGLLATGRPGGFLLYFVVSMVMTPLIGLLVLIITMSMAQRQTR